jgi:hypothetical protein
MFLEQLECNCLVALGEGTVADHVREHYCGESALFGSGLKHIRTDLRAEVTRMQFTRQLTSAPIAW